MDIIVKMEGFQIIQNVLNLKYTLQGSPFKLAGTFDGYYYKKYKSYKNF